MPHSLPNENGHDAQHTISIGLDFARDSSGDQLERVTEAELVPFSDPPVDTIGDFPDTLCTDSEVTYVNANEVLPFSAFAQSPDASTPWQFLTVEDVLSQPPLEYLVEELIPCGGFVQVYGPSGSGKSFIVLDVALRLAETETVIYIAGEGHNGFKKRVEAWAKYHKCDVAERQFIMSDRAVSLMNEQELVLLLRELGDIAPSLVIIDPLARAMAGSDENSTKDMGLFVRACEHIQKETGAAVLVVHHTGWNNGHERGSSSLRAATEVTIKHSMSKDRIITWHCEKTADEEKFKDKKYRLQVVQLDDNRSSCVVVSVNGDRSKTQPKVNKTQRRFWLMGKTSASERELR